MRLRNLFRPAPLPNSVAASVPPQETPLAAAVVAEARRSDWSSASGSREAGDAWRVWRKVGEVHYSTTQQSRLVSRLDWSVLVDGDQLETVDAEELLTAAFGNDLRSLVKTAALHMQVAGGYYLARTRPGDADSWKVISNPPKHQQKKLLDNSDVVVSVRNPDPEDETRNDSPVIAALDVGNELVLARAQARASSRSRTAQLNTLLYPLEGAGPDPKSFEQDLMEVMVAPLADEHSTATVVPNLIGFPAELIDKWRTLDLTGPADEKLHDRIERLIRQLAMQLDVPPELMLGMGDVNHWGQWAIQEDNWLGHVEPLAEPVGRGLARAITLAGDLDQRVEIIPDPGPLLQRRPTPSDAIAAHSAGVVSDDWLREQVGADDSDAPAGEGADPAVALALEAVKSTPSILRDMSLPDLVSQIRAALDGRTVTVHGEVSAPDSPAVGEPPAIAASLASRLGLTAAPDPLPIDAKALAYIDAQVWDAVQDLVTDTAERTLERLGAKVRSMAQGKKIELPDVPNSELAVGYDGDIPNSDHTIADTISATVPRLDRAISRAFARTRDEGVPLEEDRADSEAARSLYQTLTAEVVRVALSGRPTSAEEWTASRRVVAVAGGNGDSKALTAAAGVRVTGLGIALGYRAVDSIRAVYHLVPNQWRWMHQYSGPSPHPEHQMLDGRTFNGDYILDGGVNWFPGDHAGCQCLSIPDFVREG